jgi:hypothetical protein
MATRPVLRKPGQHAYSLTLVLSDREAEQLIEFPRQLKAGKVRIVRSRSRKSAKSDAR